MNNATQDILVSEAFMSLQGSSIGCGKLTSFFELSGLKEKRS
jgi:hypothetical protein